MTKKGAVQQEYVIQLALILPLLLPVIEIELLVAQPFQDFSLLSCLLEFLTADEAGGFALQQFFLQLFLSLLGCGTAEVVEMELGGMDSGAQLASSGRRQVGSVPAQGLDLRTNFGHPQIGCL